MCDTFTRHSVRNPTIFFTKKIFFIEQKLDKNLTKMEKIFAKMRSKISLKVYRNWRKL